MSRDLFISYASEDREAVARPLAEWLAELGVSVWFDQFDLKLGDSLRQKIDAGLTDSRFGVVLLSTSFFGKHYPVRELDGLAQREIGGDRVILPIWLDVTDSDVRRFSPPLADRIAAKWEEGLPVVARKILEIVRPDILQTIIATAKELPVPRVRSGQQLGSTIAGAHFSYIHNDEPEDEAEAKLIGDLLQEIRDWSEIWDDIEPSEHVRTEVQLTQLIREVEAAGWFLYAAKRQGRRKVAGVVGDWKWFVAAAVRGEPEHVLSTDDKIIVLRAPSEQSS